MDLGVFAVQYLLFLDKPRGYVVKLWQTQGNMTEGSLIRRNRFLLRKAVWAEAQFVYNNPTILAVPATWRHIFGDQERAEIRGGVQSSVPPFVRWWAFYAETEVVQILIGFIWLLVWIICASFLLSQVPADYTPLPQQPKSGPEQGEMSGIDCALYLTLPPIPSSLCIPGLIQSSPSICWLTPVSISQGPAPPLRPTPKRASAAALGWLHSPGDDVPRAGNSTTPGACTDKWPSGIVYKYEAGPDAWDHGTMGLWDHGIVDRKVAACRATWARPTIPALASMAMSQTLSALLSKLHGTCKVSAAI